MCNYLMYGNHGIIKSYGYPNPYPPDAECFYRIAVPLGNTIVVSFKRFFISESLDCRYEYLTIHNGPLRSSPIIGQFCGREIPNSIQSSSNTLLILFRSRKRQSSATGFIGFYQISSLYKQCQHQHFSCFNGQCIALSKRCDGILDCQDGSDEYICGKLVADDLHVTQIHKFN